MLQLVYRFSLALFAATLFFTSSLAEEPARAFLDALRARGMQDVAMDYLQQMQTSRLAPRELKETILLERSLLLIEISRQQRDMQLRAKQLNEAQSMLEEFVARKSSHPKVNAARSQLGSLIVERARMKHQQASDGKDDAMEKQSRALYEKAFKVFADLQAAVDKELSEIPVALDTRDRKQAALIQRRKQLRADFLQTELLAAAIREEVADHVTEGSEEQKKYLTEAAGMYDGIYKKYRTRLAGMYARMYQGRCNKRLGKTKDALGYFGELLDQPSEESLIPLKAKTLRLAMETWLSPGQRKYVEAIRRATKWFDESPREKLREPDWLAVRYSLARAYKMQADDAKSSEPVNRQLIEQSLAAARRDLKFVASEQGEFQKPAQDLLSLLGGPNMAADEDPTPKSFNEAQARGKEAMDLIGPAATSVQQLQAKLNAEKNAAAKRDLSDQLAAALQRMKTAQADAIGFYRLALELADEKTPQSNKNLVHYFLCYLYYLRQDYYDAALMGDFVAQRYPSSPGAKQCAKIAMACYLKLLEQNESGESGFEVNRLFNVGNYMAATWPSDSETEVTLATLIPYLINAGQPMRAAEFVDKLPKQSQRRAGLELVTGQSIWGAYLQGSQNVQKWKTEGTPEDIQLGEYNEQLGSNRDRARELLVAGYGRLPGNTSADASTATALLSLAQVYVDDVEPQKAIEVLENPSLGPLTLVKAKDPAAENPIFVEETYRTALRAYVGALGAGDAGLMDKAKGIMEAMRQKLGKDQAGQKRMLGVYVSLAQDIENQMKSADPQARQQMSQVFEAFLLELSAGSNDLSVLNWVAETFAGLGAGFDTGDPLDPNASKYYSQAVGAFRNLSSLNLPAEMATQTKIRLATMLGKTGEGDAALELYQEVLRQNPSAINVQVAAAELLQKLGQQNASRFEHAIAGFGGAGGNKIIWGWIKLGLGLERYKQHRETFFLARYQLANCRKQLAASKGAVERKQMLSKAAGELRKTVTLYPNMNETWRKKYDQLLGQINSAIGK